MINILERCSKIINILHTNGRVCSNYTDIRGCYTCLRNNFQPQGTNDTYNCLTKLALYTINYGPIYVSEIYHFIEQSQFLENNFLNIDRPIIITSLGCGFGPDDMAIHRYKIDKQLPIDFNYFGYDIEPLWKYITNSNALPITYDILNGIDCHEIDILFINKLFSTLKKNNFDKPFLSMLGTALRSLPNGSFVVFNDINSIHTGRDDFHNFAINNSLTVVGRYYFNVSGTNGTSAYNNGYIEISSSHNICQIPQNFQHSPKLNANQTVFFLYQKVV